VQLAEEGRTGEKKREREDRIEEGEKSKREREKKKRDISRVSLLLNGRFARL
jgi:hypothetical protein